MHPLNHIKYPEVYRFRIYCVCVCCVSQGPYSIRIVLSNLFGFHDLLVDFRYMTSKLGENLFPNYMRHLLFSEEEELESLFFERKQIECVLSHRVDVKQML